MRRCAKKVQSLLTDYNSKVQSLTKLNAAVQAQLPASVKAGCEVANFRDGTLVLHITAPALTMRMRYEVPGLLKRLQQHTDIPVTEIRCRNRVVETPSAIPPAARPIRPSGAAIECLGIIASKVNSDKLQAALSRLANTLSSRTN